MSSKFSYRVLKVVRDTREKKGCGWYFRASAKCDGTVVKKLDTGDYSIEGYEHLVMIERKTKGDLWQSLTTWRERFMREMDRSLKYPVRFLIVEATVKDIAAGYRYSKVPADYIFASLTSLQIKYGIHVIFTHKDKSVAQAYVRKMLHKLFKYCEEGIITKDNNGRPEHSE